MTTPKEIIAEARKFLAEGRHRWTRGALYRTKSGSSTDILPGKHEHVERCCSIGAISLASVRLGASETAQAKARLIVGEVVEKECPGFIYGLADANDRSKKDGGLGYDGVLCVFEKAEAVAR